MNLSDRPLPVATLIACLSLCACRDTPQEDRATDLETASPEITNSPAPASTEKEITGLQREIKAHEQTIEDLGAAVVMERAKLDDDPEYDQSFLNSVLEEQDQERLKIEEAEERIKMLTQ